MEKKILIIKLKNKTRKVIFMDETEESPKYCDLLINEYPGSKKYYKYN